MGLPSGGTARLVIEEIAYDVTASADADGNVTFVVPLIQVGATVTVELSVMDANGTLLWYGSKTGQANDGFNLDITLESQVAPPAEVIMKTGSAINTALKALGANAAPEKTFSASPTPPAAGTVTELLSDTGSSTEVLAWLDADGSSIKYYAEGYTDASPAVRIPLNADSARMFNECRYLTSIELNGFDTGNVTSMEWMFGSCTRLSSLDVSSFDTRNVTDMTGMFRFCEALTSLDLRSFDTRRVNNMEQMFASCKPGLTSLDLSSFDTSSVTSMNQMFFFDRSLATIYVSAGFVTTSVSDSTKMFEDCFVLVGGAGTAFSSSAPVDRTYACIDDPANGVPGYFTRKP